MKRLPLLALLLVLGLIARPAHAAWTTLWTLGVQDGSNDGFGSEAYPNYLSPNPDSAITRDDDYYFAGTGYAVVGAVATDELTANFESALSTWDSTTRIHFKLSPAQAASTSQLRVFINAIWGGFDNGRNFGTHQLQLKLNGVIFSTQTFTYPQPLVATVNVASVTALNGEYILELSRSGGSTDGWFHMDNLGMSVNPTALTDADGDGLPQWWEEFHGLSDSNGSDAALDPDHDNRTNLQEFTAGTNPNLADTDGDGLNDGAETTTNPLLADTDSDSIKDGDETTTSPLLIDTDSDGAPDAWEIRAGTNPALSSSTPPAFTAAVGVHFTSENAPTNVLTPYQVTGLLPQMNWNNTVVLPQWDANNIAGSTADIASPTAGVLKNSAGTSTTMTVNWSADATWSAGNSGSSNQDLLNSALWVNGDTPASVTFGSIPFTTYDLIVYVGNTYEGAIGYTRLNDNTSTDKYFSSASVKPQSEFIEPAINNPMHPWRGNVIRYRNLTGSTCNVKLYRTSWHEVGIHAVQIVNAALDSDGDGMPDWWEVMHKLRPNFNDAALDPDGDGLSNVNEFARSTDPNKADTDGDGLTDNAETGTGIYVNMSNTGSNPLVADTDGDGLSDGAEVNALPVPLNPNHENSDGDSLDDAAEVAQHRDPVVNNDVVDYLMPTMTGTTSKVFDWTLYFQLVWDHERGHTSDGEWGDTELAWIEVQNREDNFGGGALAFGIRRVSGSLTWLFFSSGAGGFSYPSQPGNDIWHSDWNTPPTNLMTAMGFSGYGRQDISKRLRLKAHATTTGSPSAWNLTVSLFNVDTNTTISTQNFDNCTLAPHIHDRTVTWTDADDIDNQLYTDLEPGISLYLLNNSASPSIETFAAFANARDTDRDGMPDVWETTHSFNLNIATDAAEDTDNDGLTNVRECQLGTNPRNADTDGDGAKDGVEVDARSNPLLASSKPPFWNGLPSGISGEDLNGNGISDAFELWLGRFDLLGNGDSDGDGFSNADEARAGTNPLDANSRLWSLMDRAGSNVTVRWPRLLNKTHQVQQSDNLASWSAASGSPVINGNEYQQTITNALSNPRKFYRAAVADVDTDGDGVSDWAEANVLGTTLNNSNSSRTSMTIDTNGDGTPETTVSGDYATLLETMQGSSGQGGFAGGTPLVTSIGKAQAARFLTQATFGPTLDDIERVQQLGYTGWINEQMAITPTLHSTYVKQIIADYMGPRADRSYVYNEDLIFGVNMQTAFARAAVQGSDQLRQRVAFALSQILVTSRKDANLQDKLLAMADYYDIFVRRAFGNYQDILLEVTLHPCMGRYLSHVGNQKANPAINQYPDENYAREIMQLFTIGLWQLNQDGTRVVVSGQNVPTYSNTEITHLARVMTGLWFGEHEWGNGGWQDADYATPMTMHADRHDFDAKTLVGGYVIPARQPTKEDAMRDIQDAVRHLFNHSNTAPFISRQLIQFLVTDNPSPAFVQRVAAVFANNGSGVRGDLGAVVKAILLDDEARNPSAAMHDSSYGRLKEPTIRAMALGRAFGLKSVSNLLWWNWSEFYDASRQEPGYSPSVFNFYRPDYKAPGLLTTNQKNGPVFQITDSYSSIAFPNKLWEIVTRGFWVWHTYSYPLDLSREISMASSPEKLVDHLNLLCCAGQMSVPSRTLILSAINQIPASDPEARARVAVYLAIVTPEGAVMK